MTTKTKSLSDTQLKALKRLSARGVVAYYQRYMGRFNPNAYWFIADDIRGRRATKQIQILIELGFLSTTKDSLGYTSMAKINDAGIEFLKSQK